MKPGAGWPIGIVAILATTIGVNLAVMRIAGNDPSFAVEPDYYRKAVQHDSTMAQADSNRVLGWSASAAIVEHEGRAQLDVRVADSSGVPIDDAAVSAIAMYVGRAAAHDTVSLVFSGAGRYAGVLATPHAGQWEVRIDVHRGARRFTRTARVEAPVIASRRTLGLGR